MTTTVPLESLAQRIARHQAELEGLRREYDARQTHLADLTLRKQELQDQLRQLDAEIRAVNQGKKLALPGSSKRLPTTAAPAPASPGSIGPQTLSGLLIRLVAGSKEPLTVKQLTQEVVSRKFPTTSQNVPGLVQTRVRELVDKGIFRRAHDQPGFVLAQPAGEVRLPAAKPALRKGEGKKSVGSSAKARPTKRGGRPAKPLRVVLTELLAKSQLPLPAKELARQAKAQGYRTKSKKFVDVLWVMLGKMDNVENVPGLGYRLKKGKTARS